MADDPMYHDDMRRLQDVRDTRRLADRLEQVIVRSAFTNEDRAFIEQCSMFFVAAADAEGRYIHEMQLLEHSAYAPRPGYTPPVPAWKTFDEIRDALPARDRKD